MHDKALDQLIATLKTEAIEAAEQAASEILENAKLQAEEMVQTAVQKKDELIVKAEQEAQALLDKGKRALRQAGRDYSISVRNELLSLFKVVLEKETQQVFTPDLLKTTIMSMVDNLGREVEIGLAPALTKEVAAFIHQRLQSPATWLTVVEDNTILRGFSVRHHKEGWSYDISPEEVAEALQTYLHRDWVYILNNEIADE